MQQDKTIRLRRSEERGYEDLGWADNWLTFSFFKYYDPEWIHFGPIRAITENHIQPHQGFQPHPHKDMEIITYVSRGTLTHQDNNGNKEEIHAGQMQRMTAGSGIVHSEMNEHEEVEHNIQIWILPDKEGRTPGYQIQRFGHTEQENTFQQGVSKDGRSNTIQIHQDVDIYAGILSAKASFNHLLQPGRGAWIQVVRGGLSVNNTVDLWGGRRFGNPKK
jgi:redox-sensitive bicupin YhaK (pirin superfamily)